MDINAIDRRRLELESERSGVEEVWNLVEEFVFPFRGKFLGDKAADGSLDWRKRSIYDSTAAIANQNLGANLNSGLTNPLFQWFFLKIRQKELADNRDVKIWLQEVSRIIFEYLRDSNFNLKANECYLDLPSFGTASMVEEVKEKKDGDLDKLIFESIRVGEYVFELDTEGNVYAWWFVHTWTIRQVVDKFGLFALPESLQQKAIHNPGDSEKIEIVHYIARRDDVDYSERFQILAPEKRPFTDFYYHADTKTMVGEEGGSYEMPVYIPRWRTTAGSVWGNSPAMVCLSNILSLNELLKYILRNAEKVVDPPTVGTQKGIISNVDLRPGGHTVVRNLKDIDTFFAKGDLQAGELGKNDLRSMIERMFFMDQLQLKESPAMTATEVNARFQLMQRLLGPTLNRLTEDWLDRVIERTFGILFRYKKLPEMPEVLRETGADWDIEYAGPIAKAQRESQAQSVEQFLGTVITLLQGFEEAKDVPKVEELVAWLAELRGIPLDKLNSVGERANKQKNRQEQMVQAQKMEMISQGSAAAKNIAEAQAVEQPG